jgi:hypothetical protein
MVLQLASLLRGRKLNSWPFQLLGGCSLCSWWGGDAHPPLSSSCSSSVCSFPSLLWGTPCGGGRPHATDNVGGGGCLQLTQVLLSFAPQPSLGLGLLHKIRLNFLEASQQFSFYRVGLLAPRQTPIPEDQASVFISPSSRVATHFSRLLRHVWVTVGLFLFPGHHTGKDFLTISDY